MAQESPINFYELRESAQKLAQAAIELARKPPGSPTAPTTMRAPGDAAAEANAHAARTLGILAAAVVELAARTASPVATVESVKSALDKWVALVGK